MNAVSTTAILPGAVTETFGARLALGYQEADELFHNLAPGVVNEDRGEESLNPRLTLLWEPSFALFARPKSSYAQYDNDGSNSLTEETCPEGSAQPTAVPAASAALALLARPQ